MSDAAIAIEALRFAWPGHPPVLDIDSFAMTRGERLFLRGPSGSGKSTLLGLIAGVLQPAAGRIEVLGRDMSALSAAARDRVRADHLGVIFQMFNLVPYLSVTGNVTLPLLFSPVRRKTVGDDAEGEARRLLDRLGLSDPGLLNRRVSDLSVGQQQRVAAARALIGGPDIKSEAIRVVVPGIGVLRAGRSWVDPDGADLALLLVEDAPPDMPVTPVDRLGFGQPAAVPDAIWVAGDDAPHALTDGRLPEVPTHRSAVLLRGDTVVGVLGGPSAGGEDPPTVVPLGRLPAVLRPGS